jgi:hypothetical protein
MHKYKACNQAKQSNALDNKHVNSKASKGQQFVCPQMQKHKNANS